jgi:glycosyltransferase involved in cell wall biosynthesis
MRSNVVLTHTLEHRREVAAAWGMPADKIRIIPHGIKLPPRGELVESRGGRLRLLFVGRCERRKGIDVLLAALPAVFRSVPLVDCEVIGSDPNDYWQKAWLQAAPANCAQRLRFCGTIDDTALQAAYRTCDLFVAPSLYESFGLIYVEAMAWGKPVIGGRAGGVPEVVEEGKTGALVSPGNAAELAGAIIGLLEDEQRRLAWGAAGRVRAEERFSRLRLAQASSELYAEMSIRR